MLRRVRAYRAGAGGLSRRDGLGRGGRGVRPDGPPEGEASLRLGAQRRPSRLNGQVRRRVGDTARRVGGDGGEGGHRRGAQAHTVELRKIFQIKTVPRPPRY